MHHIKLFKLTIVAAFTAFSAAGEAQTITVAKSGASSYTTVQAAIDHFDVFPDPDPAPNVIQITDSSVYDEVIDVYLPVLIEGTAESRPILAAQNHSDSPNEGIRVSNLRPYFTTNSIVLKNLIVIPSLTAPPIGYGIRSSDQDLYFELNNVLITANTGSNAPVSTDGLTSASTEGAVFFGDGGLFMRGDGQGFTGVLKKTVITHMLGPSGPQDGLMLYQWSSGHYRILDGCVFSFCNRLGIFASGRFQIDAPTTKCLIINNGGFAGLWWARGGGVDPQQRKINGAIIANNAGFGIEHQNGDSTGLTISNSIIANNANTNLKVSEVRTDADINLINVTIGKTMNPAASAIDIDPASSATIFLKNSIIAGNGSMNPNNTLLHNGTGTLNLTGTALVTAGPLSMFTATGGTGPVNGTPTTTADPQFVNTTDVTSPDYFDVTNPIYATANNISGPLAGGADFIGNSNINDWSIY